MREEKKNRFPKKDLKKTKRGSKDKFFRKKVCRFCVDKTEVIDYKDAIKLRKFITEQGKILPNRISGNCASHQRTVAIAIKRARHVALLPFVGE